MSDQPTWIEHEARIKMLEEQLKALIKVLGKEGVAVEEEINDELKESLESDS